MLLNGADVTASFAWDGRVASAQLAIADGPQHLEATIQRDLDFLGTAQTETHFEAVTLADPDICDVLNQAACVLPFPSSRYQVPDPDTDTGLRMAYPVGALPAISAGSLGNLLLGEPRHLDPELYNYYDGVSPTVQPIMHFPGGVDLAASGAPRLLEATRNFDLRGLDADSPSVLLDANTGERIVHFLENDSHATGASGRAPRHDPAPRQEPHARPSLHRRDAQSRRAGRRSGRARARLPDAARRRADDDRRRSRRVARTSTRRSSRCSRRTGSRATTSCSPSISPSRPRAISPARCSRCATRPSSGSRTRTPATTFTVTQVTQLSNCASPGDYGWREVRGTFRVPNFLTRDGVVAGGSGRGSGHARLPERRAGRHR